MKRTGELEALWLIELPDKTLLDAQAPHVVWQIQAYVNPDEDHPSVWQTYNLTGVNDIYCEFANGDTLYYEWNEDGTTRDNNILKPNYTRNLSV